jgi:hypothetical protein
MSGREIWIQIRTTESERAWFHQIARSNQMTLSELVRHSLALEGSRAGIAAPDFNAVPVSAEA